MIYLIIKEMFSLEIINKRTHKPMNYSNNILNVCFISNFICLEDHFSGVICSTTLHNHDNKVIFSLKKNIKINIEFMSLFRKNYPIKA